MALRLQSRDRSLVRDIALSHCLSRDQILKLGYFSSVTRLNTRLRELTELRYVKRINEDLFAQSIVMAGPKAKDIVGERIANLIAGRQGSPRFLRHALATSDVRIAMKAKGADWRHEQPIRSVFRWQGVEYDVRPDGLVLPKRGPVLLEVDLGHAARSALTAKLTGYDAFVRSGLAKSQLGITEPKVLFVTTGTARAATIRALSNGYALAVVVSTFADLGITSLGSWS